MHLKFVLILCVSFSFLACDEEETQDYSSDYSSQSNHSHEDSKNEENSKSEYSSQYNYSSEESEDQEDGENSNQDEKLSDGSHSATVDYYNPQTGYTQTYTLDVEVEDGEVTKIDFPNGGYLDNDHISPAELDEDGNVHIDGEEGKTYDVQIEE